MRLMAPATGGWFLEHGGEAYHVVLEAVFVKKETGIHSICACGYCANAGLLPTPAVFELEYACDGQLKERPQKWDLAWRNEGGGEVFSPEGTARMLPDGCAFRCRDRLPGCAAAAAQGQCTSLPEVLRKQCPASCGVCAALSLKEWDGRDSPRFAESGRDWQRFLGGGQRRLRTAGVRLRWRRQQARTRGGARA